MKQLYKGQKIALHVLDEHILPLCPELLPSGGTMGQWDAYWKKALEIVGSEYNEDDIAFAGYFVTEVVDIVGDQVLFRDSNGELHLVPSDQVITQEEAPQAFEAWLSQEDREDISSMGLE